MTASPPTSAIPDGRAAAREVTRLSIGVAVVLIALKAFALALSGSVAMMASLVDSVLDLVASLGAFYAVRWAARPADETHRFGHGKAEALSALVQAGLVFASAVFIGLEAVRRILDPQPVNGGVWGVAVVIFSIVMTAVLVWRQGQALKAGRSLAVSGDRAHYAADLAANVVVLIGLVSGVFLNAPGLDAAAGLIVAVWLFWGATGLLREAADHLLDRAAPETERVAITTAVLADPRIGGVHRLRARMSGSTVMIQMHVDLDGALSLIEAHGIIAEAEKRVLAAFPEADVLIHPDPRAPWTGVADQTR